MSAALQAPARPRIVEVEQAFTYNATVTFTAVGQEQNPAFVVQPDNDFRLEKVTHTSSDNVDVQAIVNGGALVQLIDGSDNRPLMDNPVPLDSWSGRAQRPFYLPGRGYRFRRQNSILTRFINTGTAAQVLRVSLHGVKIYFRQAA